MKNKGTSILLMLVAIWKEFSFTQARSRAFDLTHVLEPTAPTFPGYPKFKIKVLYSENTFRYEKIATVTHEGTHIDAPCHFSPDGRRLTQLTLEELIAPAAVVDVRLKVASNPDYQMQIDDLVEWEQTTGRRLDDVIVLMRSGWCKKWSNPNTFFGMRNNNTSEMHFPGISPAAAFWLVEHRNVFGVGVESTSLDYGLTKDNSAHKILLSNDKFGIENIDCMDGLPLYGATLYVMPMKIGNACGAPTRLAATVPT